MGEYIQWNGLMEWNTRLDYWTEFFYNFPYFLNFSSVESLKLGDFYNLQYNDGMYL